MHKLNNINNLKQAIGLGEGQFIEFKESLDKSLSKEIVAFANASGGGDFAWHHRCRAHQGC